MLRPDLVLKGSTSFWAQERLQHIARKTHTSVQSVLEVAASCVLEFQKTHSERNDEDSMEELDLNKKIPVITKTVFLYDNLGLYVRKSG